MVILFEKDTEKQSAEPLISAGTTSIVWIDSNDHGNKLQQRVLGVLGPEMKTSLKPNSKTQ